MIRSMYAELLKLRQPAIIYGAVGAMLGFALLATVLTYATATAAASFVGGDSLTSTVGQLGQPGGLTRGFTIAAGFIGLLVFVLFTTSITSDTAEARSECCYSGNPAVPGYWPASYWPCWSASLWCFSPLNCFRALRQPLRTRSRGIPTASWFTAAGLRHVAGDYANALLVASLFGTVGMTVGVLRRCTPLALGIGLAWLAPLEHLIQLSWSGAGNWLLGLVFDAVAAGGTTIMTYPRALITALACAALALAVGALSFLRRDVSI